MCVPADISSLLGEQGERLSGFSGQEVSPVPAARLQQRHAPPSTTTGRRVTHQVQLVLLDHLRLQTQGAEDVVYIDPHCGCELQHPEVLVSDQGANGSNGSGCGGGDGKSRGRQGLVSGRGRE